MRNLMRIAVAAVCLGGADTALAESASSDEVVITARRIGAPVWKVTGPAGTLVLIGAIQDIAKGTNWNPAALARSVSRADRVMFPETMQVSVSPLAMIGYTAKWKRHQNLPSAQSLAAWLTPDELRRLQSLSARGTIRGPYLNRHPYHLARELQGTVRKQAGVARALHQDLRGLAKRHGVPIVPVASGRAKPVASALFDAPPGTHLQCLRDSIALAEAGPSAIRVRSADWVRGRIPAILNSPAERVQHSCWPASTIPRIDAELQAIAQRVLAQPGTTLAVLELRTLARSGGLLDALKGRGHAIQGPDWR